MHHHVLAYRGEALQWRHGVHLHAVRFLQQHPAPERHLESERRQDERGEHRLVTAQREQPRPGAQRGLYPHGRRPS